MAKPAKIELPGDLTQPFPIPEGVTIADIDAMVSQVQRDAEKMLGDTNTNVPGATWLMDTVDQLNAHKGELVAADDAAKAEADAVRERINASKPKDPSAAADDDDDETKDGDEPSDDGGAQSQSGDATGDAIDAGTGAPVLVASSFAARRRNALALARKGGGGTAPKNLPKVETRTASLLAASEVAGFTAGQTLNLAEFGRAADKRFASLPRPGRGGPRVTNPIGSVQMASDEGLVASAGTGDFAEVEAAIEWALSMKRLEQETGADSLLAAGGWCAPSETLYDLLNMTTQDGLLNIPGITVNRGGVRYTLGPNYAAVYNAGQNFTKTEAQAIAGSAKPVVNIPCPTFADHRMVVDGMYLTGDILTQKGYPEAYADFTEKALTAFAHYVNFQTIADMEALITAQGGQVNLVQPGTAPTYYQNKSAATELLGAVELQILDMRYRNRLSLTNSVEVVFPVWIKGVIRSDLAKRAAVDNPGQISDADIDNFFALRGASVQWVYDWQDAFSGAANGFGSATPLVAYPQTVKFMIYPQGAFVRALSDVIDLSAIYDSVLLTTNQYVALFMEQARLTLLRAWDVREVTATVMITGATGAAVDYTTLQPTV